MLPHEAALRGRIGAYLVHSRHDSRQLTAPARAAFLRRFEVEVDPDGMLPADERHRRAGMARKAYFARLALKSARERAKRRAYKAPIASVHSTSQDAQKKARTGDAQSTANSPTGGIRSGAATSTPSSRLSESPRTAVGGQE